MKLHDINCSVTVCTKYPSLRSSSVNKKYATNVKYLEIPKIACPVLRIKFDKRALKVPNHVRLADSDFNQVKWCHAIVVVKGIWLIYFSM